jgi:hypothetical protein
MAALRLGVRHRVKPKGKLPWADPLFEKRLPKFKPGGKIRTRHGRRARPRGFKNPASPTPATSSRPASAAGTWGTELYENEAPFPEKLAGFFVQGWCPPGAGSSIRSTGRGRRRSWRATTAATATAPTCARRQIEPVHAPAGSARPRGEGVMRRKGGTSDVYDLRSISIVRRRRELRGGLGVRAPRCRLRPARQSLSLSTLRASGSVCGTHGRDRAPAGAARSGGRPRWNPAARCALTNSTATDCPDDPKPATRPARRRPWPR